MRKQASTHIAWLSEGGPGRLGGGTEAAIVGKDGAEASWLVAGHRGAGSWAAAWRVCKAFVCNAQDKESMAAQWPPWHCSAHSCLRCLQTFICSHL